MARKSRPMLHWRVEQVIGRRMQELGQGFVQGNGAVRAANHESVRWLTGRAIDILDENRRRAPDPRHERLASVLQNPKVHRVGIESFDWVIPAQVKAANWRVAAYYRTIEGRGTNRNGSWYWVKRTKTEAIGMLFIGSPAHPVQGASGQAGFANWRDDLPRVRIRKPIPAYHYMARAVRGFVESRQYSKILNSHLRARGLPTLRPSQAGGLSFSRMSGLGASPYPGRKRR